MSGELDEFERTVRSLAAIAGDRDPREGFSGSELNALREAMRSDRHAPERAVGDALVRYHRDEISLEEAGGLIREALVTQDEARVYARRLVDELPALVLKAAERGRVSADAQRVADGVLAHSENLPRLVAALEG